MSAWKDFFRPTNVSVGGVTLKDVIRAPYVRLAVLTATAGTLAYFLGARIPSVSAVTAAITAVISIRHTLHETVRESFFQVLGVAVGATVGYVATKAIGFNSVVVLLAIISCFAISRLFKLGEEGAIAIAVTVVLVIGPTFNQDKVETRFFGVMLGAALATFFSYFVRVGAPQDRALRDGLVEARSLSRLLHEIAVTLSGTDVHVERKQAMQWLAQAEYIQNDVEESLHSAESAVAGARWSPILDRRDAEAVLKQIQMTQATCETVINICRELVLTFGRSDKLPDLLASALSTILEATADVIMDQADVAAEDPADKTSDDEWLEERARAVNDLRGIDETQPLFIGGSILRDAEKIKDILGE